MVVLRRPLVLETGGRCAPPSTTHRRYQDGAASAASPFRISAFGTITPRTTALLA